ncbi:hypothetical protein [Spiroplasma endosymbiont of Cantharis lateralis]|uniref:hypothetical protein n=1 Tax=Spiroplasma endosymbiont of Cantharis lateralis TaxID=3066277 RepID=UPI00313D7437
MNYYSMPRFASNISMLKEDFAYLSFLDSKMDGILIDEYNEIYQRYNYSKAFNGSDLYQSFKTYDLKWNGNNENEYYLNTELQETFTYQKLDPSIFLINDTEVKLIFR